jgi:hypothetical protein
MSALPIPGKIGWRTKLKFCIVYPSEEDLVVGVAAQEYVLGILEGVSIDGIGYAHEDINGITNWGLGKKTKPPASKTGKLLIAENEWCYKFVRWLAANDGKFDIKIVELDAAQNPGFGQWKGGQEACIGCFVDALSKDYKVGELPYLTTPFSWTQFKFIDTDTGATVYIGSGAFSAGSKPTPPT